MDRRTALLKHPHYGPPSAVGGNTVQLSPTSAFKRRTRSAGDHRQLHSRLQLTALKGRPKTPILSPPRRGDAVDSKTIQALSSMPSRRQLLDPILDEAFRQQQQRADETPNSVHKLSGRGVTGVASASAKFLSKLASRGVNKVRSNSVAAAAKVSLPTSSKESSKVEAVSIGRASLETLMQRLEALEKRVPNSPAAAAAAAPNPLYAPSAFEQQLRQQLREQELRHQQQVLQQQQLQQQMFEQQQKLLLQQQQQLFTVRDSRSPSSSPTSRGRRRKRDLDVSRVRNKHSHSRSYHHRHHHRHHGRKHYSDRHFDDSTSSASSPRSIDSAGSGSREPHEHQRRVYRGSSDGLSSHQDYKAKKPMRKRRSSSAVQHRMATRIQREVRRSITNRSRPRGRNYATSEDLETMSRAEKIRFADHKIQTEAQIVYISEILIDEFLRHSIIPEILIETISMTDTDALPAEEMAVCTMRQRTYVLLTSRKSAVLRQQARQIYRDLEDEVVQQLLHALIVRDCSKLPRIVITHFIFVYRVCRLQAEQMDNMVQQIFLRRQVQTHVLQRELHK